MYRITRTVCICKGGEREVSTEVKNVADLERHRHSIMQPNHVRVNFVYQTIPDNENS